MSGDGGPGRGRRRPVGMARVLSPRGALALRTVDGAFTHAAQAAVATALPVLPLPLVGRPDYAVYAAVIATLMFISGWSLWVL
ncbi:hypothetical protein DV517_51190 [Streptomyces sp. S816]|uniref:hypothetical protein n=1 Tax=Streptomyces sp. S816 TaxID=2283197 RepID=UPI00109CA631|nr:hypothetical protein [Streptomyces sp. S816]TGZ13636.1 hypothetical protein DV517_51190 [Streptomyces sp. S816]